MNPSELSATGPGRLVSYTLPWLKTPLFEFLEQAEDAPRFYWQNAKHPTSFAATGVATRLTASGPTRFKDIQHQAQQLFADALVETEETPASIGPRLFGGFTFHDQASPSGLWSAFPAAYFLLPRFQLTRHAGQYWLTINDYISLDDAPEAVMRALKADVQHLRLALELAGPQERMILAEIELATTEFGLHYPMTQADWTTLITNTTRRIKAGDLEKVVLARVCQVHASRLFKPLPILNRLKTRYPDCFRFLIEPTPGHAFYGATPELLAEVKGRQVKTVALAGSIRRGDTPEADAAFGESLLNSVKDRQEQAFVVQAIQRNLAPLVSELRVPAEPELYKLSNIQHLNTPLTGTLNANYGVLPLVERLHPTPALGGLPPAAALPIIQHDEPFKRGWYGAPVGWIDADGNGMFAVAIRSAVSVAHEACLFAGAGIVAKSDPTLEWQETALKFRPMLDALMSSQ